MQYGTVPVVSSTGGLVDTVKEGTTGFHMGAFDPDKLNSADADAIAATVQRASQVGSSARQSSPELPGLGVLQERLSVIFGAAVKTVSWLHRQHWLEARSYRNMYLPCPLHDF